MNRQQVLRAVLMGTSVEGAHPAQLEWATIHAPLMCPSVFTPTGRRMNKFCVGSDPEFCFARDATHRAEAAGLGLIVGLAAGMDQNERLVELRPWPSVSVVKHVAGILCDLRWMYRTYWMASSFQWRAGAFFAGDGMGGHVHFGRKRPTRKEEVLALDGLAKMFMYSGMFPYDEWRARNHPDRFGQVYGNFGDFRVQAHGYEYRTLPSWLQTPATAFVAICASKLAILDPEVTATWNKKQLVDTERARTRLRGLAKLYKGRDDDAYIMYHLLTRTTDSPFDVAHTADFRPAWGIPLLQPSESEGGSISILPSSIEPDPSEEAQILDNLLNGTPITYAKIAPKFVQSVPEGYRWLPWDYRGERRSGFGDFLHNLVIHPDVPIHFGYGSHDEFHIVGPLKRRWKSHEVKLLKDFYPTVEICDSDNRRTDIVVPKRLCQGPTIGGLRAVLLHTGMFPIWTVDTVQKDSVHKWDAEHPERKKTYVWRAI